MISIVIFSDQSPIKETFNHTIQNIGKNDGRDIHILDGEKYEDIDTASSIFYPLFKYRDQLAAKARRSDSDEDNNDLYIRRPYYFY